MKNILIILSIIAIVIMIVVFSFYFYHFDGKILLEHERWGTFGDFIGGTLNPLLSFLALIALLTTIKLQSEQLNISSTELQLSREELKKSSNALIQQNENLKKQNFENTFFNLISLHNNIVNNIKISYQNVALTIERKENINDEYYGKEVFKSIINEIGFEENIIKQYINIYEKYQAILSHYFRNIYQILKLIDTAEIENKKIYTNILRAQLSNDELILIFINGITYGKKKTKPLMEKYEFLEPLSVPSKHLGNFQEIASKYNKIVFGKSNSLVYDDD